MREKISAVYKIVNTVTGDSYIGSSNDVYRRWKDHKKPSVWMRCPNNQMYKDMQTYGVDKFDFQILCPVMEEYLTQVEQECIYLMKPTYNSYNAKGINVEKLKKAKKKYRQSEKGKEAKKMYNQSEKGKEVQKKYFQSEKGKEALKKYYNQPCLYNGETLTFCALKARFPKAGIKHPSVEAKKYIMRAA